MSQLSELLSLFMRSKSCRCPANFFTQLAQRQPALVWPLVDSLLAFASDGPKSERCAALRGKLSAAQSVSVVCSLSVSVRRYSANSIL
jgi:hypothetical protein